MVRPAVLVAAEPAAGKLSIELAHGAVVRFGRAQEFLVFRLEVINAWFSESLGDIDVVPVMHAGGPILHVVMDLGGEFEEPRFPSPVVQPIGSFDVVAETDL